ncbi:zinc-dependent alcohol dehydrogenase family protein [Phytoactinopolyspora halotolerans]|uniref:Zinc-dependent alcohol dehydrogenase family protein n=1 Tax=Phytoactinopolyspora halotolerans TaxID=1981512 RepID=A0A6L9SHY7_9ACTN|nr:zinc-dependent alcohol dehydrogenase family protein [Phytoactinopolyspora halotolerans]NEE04278.1 zinc-dependent alcohol dehydrogenase family protein [Phytoactinopolyspora halotolerans]
MRAVVISKPGSLSVEDVPEPVPGPGDVVVDVGACGICGTDLHIVDGEFPPSPYPLVPGHEFAGTVSAVGDAVTTGIAVGDRVAVDPSLFCGHCRQCRRGRGNLCENWGATGDTVDGAFAERVAVPAATCYPLAAHLSFAEGALVEPVSCAVHGVRRLGVDVGERILVVGAGTMGLIMLQLLVAAGARVSVVDRVAGKLPMAERLGAAEVATSVDDLPRRAFDAAVDVTGAPPAIEDAFRSLDRGGRIEIFGVAAEDAMVRLSPFRIYNDEITVVGSMAVLHSYGAALDLVAERQVDLAPLVSHTLGLEDFEHALDLVRTGQTVKAQIVPAEGEHR